ncbi:hypothetical protein B0H16DRAFT_1724744 [Mycena metata]|uniref:Uncharacterized protein n=1 Tax=Mycena metata TaxID=1033252 RepID=A0AAD7N9I0_9AGAR|nr:hypothetical protein B0H16DRAFT_1724744 [Mycena metata]
MTLSNLHLLLDVDAKCTHTQEWDRLCTEVMILTQILSTLPQKAAFNSDFVPFEKRESQKLLTHFVYTLYYTPSEKQMGTQVIAAAISGSMVSVLEQPSTNSASTVSENKGSDSDSHSYVATEVTRPDRTAKEIVEKALSAADLNEQVADIVKAFTDGNATAAANLVVFRSRDWISRRLHDLRIFMATDPSPKHILAVLSDLRLSASNSTLVDLVGAAKFKLWGLSEEETKDKKVIQVSQDYVLNKLEEAVADVFEADQIYEVCAEEDRNKYLQELCFCLVRLNEFVRHEVYERVFTSPAVEQTAAHHILPYLSSNDKSPPRPAMRVLFYLRKLVQPIRSLQIIMGSRLPQLLQAGALDVYTIHQDSSIPEIFVRDLVEFRASFVVPPRHQPALDRLILRAFFSKASLRNLVVHHVPRDDIANDDHDLLSSVVRQLDEFHDLDSQEWDMARGSDGSVSTTSSVSAISIPSSIPSSASAGPPSTRYANEVSLGSSSEGMSPGFSFDKVCDALERAQIPAKCTAARHAECLLMATMRALQSGPRDERACVATKRPCFACKNISHALNHAMPTTHGIIFPWVPPCGLPLEDLKNLRAVLAVQLRDAAMERGEIDTTGSGSDTSSLASPTEVEFSPDLERRRPIWPTPPS